MNDNANTARCIACDGTGGGVTVTGAMVRAAQAEYHAHFWPNLQPNEHVYDLLTSALAVKIYKAMHCAGTGGDITGSSATNGEALNINDDGHFANLLGNTHPLSKQCVIDFVNTWVRDKIAKCATTPAPQAATPSSTMLVDNLRRTLGNIKDATRLADVRSLANLGLGFLDAQGSAAPSPGGDITDTERLDFVIDQRVTWHPGRSLSHPDTPWGLICHGPERAMTEGATMRDALDAAITRSKS